MRYGAVAAHMTVQSTELYSTDLSPERLEKVYRAHYETDPA
jgi:hypothetical protein